MAVVFTNYGSLDIQGLKVSGLHAKPGNKSPIGFFGTGLKYAIAVLLRHSCTITIHTESGIYTFKTKEKDFRGTKYNAVMMSKKVPGKRCSTTSLAFTTDLGKNWKLWMALRELESNCRDEGGSSTCVDENIDPIIIEPRDRWTTIVVEGCDEEYLSCFEGDDLIFLPDEDEPWFFDANEQIEVYRKPSKYLYYKGIRSYELSKPSLYTYNITSSQELTEDRTIKYIFFVNWAIARVVRASDNATFIKTVVTADDEKHWEGAFEVDDAVGTPSTTFLDIISDHEPKQLNKRAASYYNRYMVPEDTEDPTAELLKKVDNIIIKYETESLMDEEEAYELFKEVSAFLQEV